MRLQAVVKWFLGAVLVVLALDMSFAGEIALGSRLPMANHKMKSVDGKMVAVQDIRGTHGTLVAFWCNHCPVVKAYKTRLVKLAEAYGPKGIGVIAVNANDPGKASGDSLVGMVKDAKKFGYNFPYVVDDGSVLAKALGASKTPHVFLFDAESTLVYVGGIDDSMKSPDEVRTPWLKNAMESLVNGKKPELQKTRAFGCSIKWYSK